MSDRQTGGRVTAFLANGGGAITFRVALSALLGVTLWLLQSFGSHIVSQLDDLAKSQARMAALVAGQAEQLRDTAGLSSRNADRLDDHEHRITILETSAPHARAFP